METQMQFGLGANESAKDYRTLKHELVGAPQIKVKGGSRYPADKILHQHKIGICTAISLIQNVHVATGKLYSMDWQYLIQKLGDGNWLEGSSPFRALFTGKKIGFLPIEHLPSILDSNPNITYEEYVTKLRAIADNPAQMERLMALCEFPMKGYATVNVNDDYAFSKAIADSKAGVIVRFSIGDEMWTDKKGNVSWKKEDLQPQRKPKTVVSGHQMSTTYFDYTTNHMAVNANTWGPTWCDNGSILFDMNTVRPTEAWIPYYDFKPNYVPLPDQHTWSHTFVVPMKLGDVSEHVKALQVKLMLEGCMERVTVEEWGIYGNKTRQAVYLFQLKRNIPLSVYEKMVLRGSQVGPKTLKELNK